MKELARERTRTNLSLDKEGYCTFMFTISLEDLFNKTFGVERVKRIG